MPDDVRRAAWRFSARTAFPLGVNALSVAVARRRAAGAPILDLTISNPTTVGLTAPWSDVSSALSLARAAVYEPAPLGLEVARAAVAGYYAARGFAVEPERVCLTASTSEAYAFVFKLLCDPGDRVLVPTPSYPLFDYLAGLEGVHVDRYPLHYAGGWMMDVAALEAAVTPRTRAVVVVSPNNPTGSYCKRGEREALRRVCARHGLALVCDEVFADYPLRDDADGQRVRTFVDEAELPAFVLSGLSKVAALPQLKLGWMILAGPKRWADAARERLEVVADTYLSVGAPVMHAAPTLLGLAMEVSTNIDVQLRRNLATLRAAMRGTSCTLLEVEGGWSAAVRVPSLAAEEAMCVELLDREGVLVHPGHFFDFPGEAFVVVSLLTDCQVFDEGLRRLLRYFDDASPRSG